MTYYDEKLQQLQEQMARSKQLEAMIKELRNQRDSLTAQVRELESIKLEEQADVDRLEGRCLAAFFYNVEADWRRYESELSALRGCEHRYDEVLKEKADAIKAAGGSNGEEILKLEERNAFLESQKKELQEAISAGNAALSTTQQVLSSLDSAEGWGTWDLFGGGLVANLAKHSHLDEAQGAIEQLQSQLRRFKTELADVTIQADMQVNVDGFLRFADYFFDGLFADWAVLDKINQSQSQVQNTKSQIASVLSRLDSMMRTLEQEQVQIKSKLDTLVRDAQL